MSGPAEKEIKSISSSVDVAGRFVSALDPSMPLVKCCRLAACAHTLVQPQRLKDDSIICMSFKSFFGYI